MDLLNKLGAVSFVLTILALWLLGEKDPNAFIIFSASMIIQGYIFIKTKQWFLTFQMAVLLAFNVFNYIKWTG